MPSKLTCLRVFIASPGGLAEERRAFRDAVQEFNDADGMQRQIVFQAVGWEDTLGGVGRPQSIINGDVRAADYLLLVLWDRWGSSPGAPKDSGRFTSGSEEEFSVALECIAAGSMRQAVVMFKAVDPKQLSDPGEQLRRVLEFREGLERSKNHLFHTFDTTEAFRRLVHRFLSTWLHEEERGGEGMAVFDQVASPAGSVVDTVGLLEDAGAAHGTAVEHAWRLACEGHLTEAEVEFSRAVVGTNDPSPLGEYGRFLRRLGRLDQSTVMFEAALRLAYEAGDHAATAEQHRNLADILYLRGDLAAAEARFREALAIDEGPGGQAGVASDLRKLGDILYLRGDLDGAEELHGKALEIDERLGLHKGMASDFRNLGKILHLRRDLVGAEELHRKALEIDERLGFHEGTASDFRNLGNVLLDRGDLDGAEELHRKALGIDERLGDLEAMACDNGNLGLILRARGDLDGAEELHRKALEIDERLGKLEGMACDYVNLGLILRARGDLDGAEELHLKALEIDEGLGHLQGMSCDYVNLGLILRARGDLDGAAELQLKACEINQRLETVAGRGGDFGSLDIIRRSGEDLRASGEL